MPTLGKTRRFPAPTSNSTLVLRPGLSATETPTAITVPGHGSVTVRIEGRAAFAAGDASPVLRYLAARRARIAGALTLDGDRLDIVADRSYRELVAAVGPLDPHVFGAEVGQVFHAWLADLYARGFFLAVSTRRLTRAQYVYAISNMHQFVRWTTRLLGHAVAHAHDPELRSHFLHHLQGEVNHELIIERDLAHLGEDVGYVVERMAPSPATQQFVAIQDSLVAMHHDLVRFLASPLAAEGIASHLTPEFLEALEAVIGSWGVRDPRKAMMFFSSHVSTDGGDDGHWQLVMDLVRKRLVDDTVARRFLATFRAVTRSLTAMYDEMVDL